MPDLEMLLRDLRPAPEPDWAARLDKRVAARFPGPPPRWQALRQNFFAFGVAGALASMVIVVVVLGVRSHSDPENLSSPARMKAAPAPHSDSASGAAAPATAALPEIAARVQRKDASLTLSCTPAQVP